MSDAASALLLENDRVLVVYEDKVATLYCEGDPSNPTSLPRASSAD